MTGSGDNGGTKDEMIYEILMTYCELNVLLSPEGYSSVQNLNHSSFLRKSTQIKKLLILSSQFYAINFQFYYKTAHKVSIISKSSQ